MAGSGSPRLVRITEAPQVGNYDVEVLCQSRDVLVVGVPELRPAVEQYEWLAGSATGAGDGSVADVVDGDPVCPRSRVPVVPHK